MGIEQRYIFFCMLERKKVLLIYPTKKNDAIYSFLGKDYVDTYKKNMGNTVSCLKCEYDQIEEKCTRCGREGHNMSVCYASSHPDGSRIAAYCQNCGRYGHTTNMCNDSGCVIA